MVLFSNKVSRETRKAVAWIWVWLIYQILLFVVGFSTSAIGNYMTILFFYCTVMNGLLIQDLYDLVHVKRLAKFICLIVVVNLIDNIRLGIIYPECNSYLYQSWGSKYLLMNVGGTEFDAAIMFLCGTVVACLLWYQKRIKRSVKTILIFFCLSMLYYLIFISGRATSIVFLCAIIIFAMFRGNKKVLIPALVLLGILYLLSDASIFAIIGNDRIASRLSDISDLIRGNRIASDSSLVVRFNKACESISTFLSSPTSFIIGVGNHDTLSQVTGIGHHSEIIDILPKYGVVGILLFSIVLTKISKKMHSSNKQDRLFSFVYRFFVLYSFFNVSVAPEIGTVVFMLTPTLLPLLLNKIEQA